jgi:hypothetical protein
VKESSPFSIEAEGQISGEDQLQCNDRESLINFIEMCHGKKKIIFLGDLHFNSKFEDEKNDLTIKCSRGEGNEEQMEIPVILFVTVVE